MNTPAPRIAVLGSINVDLVLRCAHLPQPGETLLAESSSEVSGGKGANQAVAAARLGSRVTMIGRVGDDAYAERLLERLSCDELDTSLVQRTDECASGMAIVAVEQSGENSIIVLPGANNRITEADVELASEAISKCEALLVQLEIPTTAVAAALSTARRHGVRTILNPAPVTKRLPEELLNVDVVCPNQPEASALVGRTVHSRDDALDAAVQLTRMGPAAAIVTMGAEGAVYCDGQQSHWCESYAVEVVDTTAAGDAFAAALAVRLAEGANLPNAVQFACAAGALAVTIAGAQPSLSSRDRVEAMIAQRR